MISALISINPNFKYILHKLPRHEIGQPFWLNVYLFLIREKITFSYLNEIR